MHRRFQLIVIFIILVSWQSTDANLDSNPPIQTNNQLLVFFDGVPRILNTDYFSLTYSSDIAEAKKIACLLDLACEHFLFTYSRCGFELHLPKEQLRWVIFNSSNSFSRYAFQTEKQDLSWLKGYYSAKTNMVAIVSSNEMSKWKIKAQKNQAYVIACPQDAETGLAKVVHEVAHQLSFNTGLQKRRVMYPVWANEGLAMFFEQSLLSEYFKISRYTNLREERLVRLYQSGKYRCVCLQPSDAGITEGERILGRPAQR